MTEYITKERAQDLIVTSAQGNSSRLACMLGKLEDEPPADVVPAVHGEWRYVGSNWECSNCLFPVYSKSKFYRYCPQCGARMEGGGSE